MESGGLRPEVSEIGANLVRVRPSGRKATEHKRITSFHDPSNSLGYIRLRICKVVARMTRGHGVGKRRVSVQGVFRYSLSKLDSLAVHGYVSAKPLGPAEATISRRV